MARRSQIIIIGIIIALMAGIFLYRTSTAPRRKATHFIIAIEEYRTKHGRLPHPDEHAILNKLGFKEQATPHFQYDIGEKQLSYRITIVEGFDGPYWTYNSLTQNWRKQ